MTSLKEGKPADKWQKMKQALRPSYGHVKIEADGYTVDLMKASDGEKIWVQVWVNGVFEGRWTAHEDGLPKYPEGRFLRPMKRATWKRSQFAELKKIFGKKQAEEMITPRVIGFLPDFGTAGSAVAHFKKHFPECRLIEPGEPAGQ